MTATSEGNFLHSASSRFTGEFELIVRCAHLDARERDAVRLRALLDRPLDWTSVLGLAQRHGVTARLHRALDDADAVGVPPRARRLLERRTAREAERADRQRTSLRAALQALAGARIDAIPLRCARLSDWGDDLVELDLLVRRSDVIATWRLLTARGLAAEAPLSPPQERAHVSTQAARRFTDPAGSTVSVQWDLADRAVVHGPPIDELWRRAAPGTFDGQPCLRLDAADALVVACLRGTLKRWQRLLWVIEVAHGLAAADPGDLETALARAVRGGARRALALGASLAAGLLGAPTSPPLAESARDPAVRQLSQATVADLAAPARPLPGPSDIARFHLASRERLGDQLRYLVRRATLPDVDDVSARRGAALSALLVPVRRAVRAGVDLARRTRRYRRRQIARFVPTPPHIVDRMLALAGVTREDTLLDLGCGDGAIVIRAAQRIGCRGVGVDFDAGLVEAARRRARAAGVDRLVKLRHGDAREMDLSPFTAVCIYLGAAGNPAVRPLLQHGLRPGARVVSFNFDMADWWPDDVEVIDETPWGSNTLYLWRIEPTAAREAAA